MLTLLLRALIALNSAAPAWQADDFAHGVCERAVYSALAPLTPDDCDDPLAEVVASVLCRNEGFAACDIEQWRCTAATPCPQHPVADAVRQVLDAERCDGPTW
jgi:hypothetical protein